MFDGKQIGLLGGGQLGSMLIRHAIDMGLSISVMDKDVAAPGARYTSRFCAGDPMDYDDVVSFGESLDTIIIEKEAVNTKALRHLIKKGVKVFPSPETIDVIKDKFIQKEFLINNKIPVVPCVPVMDRKDLENYIEKLPGCLKKCTSGYDGKGVMIIKDKADIANAFDEPSILEELVEIKNEISVIVARDANGLMECYDPVMMIFDQKRHLLDFQICPANIKEELALEACSIAIKIAEAAELTGIMAVEMFITKDGKLLVNELAPRPHNSGHHTIEACVTSQYEQYLRIITGMPLGDTSLNQRSVMINIIDNGTGKIERPEQFYSRSGVHFHWYGKKQQRAGRKIGHVTIVDNSMENVLSKAASIRNILNKGL